MRLERKMAKQAAKGLPAVIEKKPPKNQEKSLKDFLNEAKPDDKHKLKVNIKCPWYIWLATFLGWKILVAISKKNETNKNLSFNCFSRLF